MASLGPPPVGWQDAILAGARQFMSARICFYAPTHSGIPYNPVTGVGGEDGIEIIWAGKARVQPVRTPKEYSTDYELEATRYFRFQLDPEEPDNPIPFIEDETLARVLDGARDEKLESLVFTATSAINSSDMAVRTVALATNMKPIAWSWILNENGDVVDA